MTSDLGMATGPGGLLTAARSLTAEQLDAYFYSFTQAQMDARGVNPDATTGAYYGAMLSSLKQIGWVVYEADAVQKQGDGAPQTPLSVCLEALVDMIQDALGGFLPVNHSITSSIADGAARELQNPALATARQLDTWWDGTVTAVDLQVMTVGTMIEFMDVLYILAGHFSMHLSADSWRSLVEPTTGFRISAKPAILRLDQSAYSRREYWLKQKLKKQLSGKIEQTTLDFGDTSLGGK